MYTNIIGTQQIVITAAFLGVMILILIILRRKSTVIRASMKAGKRVSVVEDTVVSPTERLRLIKIDAQEFIMVSAKGHAPSLVSLAVSGSGSHTPKIQKNASTSEHDALDAAVADAMQAHATAKPFIKSDPLHAASQINATPSDDQQRAFAKTFQSWRQQNAAR
jgi:flagellar biogenesis protein FliO